MKAILLVACGLLALLTGGCESDLPPNPHQPTVAFGNNQFRDDAAERPTTRATDREKNVW
jgi:hypothetical protein